MAEIHFRMKLLSIFTNFLHHLPSEFSHNIALKGLKILNILGILKIFFRGNKYDFDFDERDLRNHPSMVGIAAGLDKNGDYIDSLAALGVGFIEVGTITPKAQKGNPKPRIFRNLQQGSLLNRLGFNNKGVDYLVANLKNKKSKILVGTSIGKNFDTPNERAAEDYIYCLEKVYEYSDYIAINISSPNTKNLRDLSQEVPFNALLKILKKKQNLLSQAHGYKPIFVKISPDESAKGLSAICKSIKENSLDGIICSNTTIDHKDENGMGGVSGKPLTEKAINNLVKVREILGNDLTVIASGGVMSAQDYVDRINKGANFVQLYTGLIFEGPKLIADIVNLSSNSRNT